MFSTPAVTPASRERLVAAPAPPAVGLTRLDLAILPVLCAFLLLSGAAGLVYQVAWVRLLGLVFGVTIHAISTVLAAFTGGLAIGSVAGGRLGSPSPIRVDPQQLAERLADSSARASLAEVGLNHPQDVLTHFRADTEELRAYVGVGPILTDDRPLLEYFQSTDIAYEPPDLGRFSSDASKVLAAPAQSR